MMGWLSATPDKRNETRYKDYVNRNHGPPPMPEIEFGEHVIGYLQEVGPALNTGQGLVPLTFSEIDAWMRMVGVALTSWEASVLKRLSDEYVAEHHAARKPQHPQPWTPIQGFDKEAIAKGMRGILGKISAKRDKK